MEENSIEAKYNVTKKSRLLRFYESNKLIIFSTAIVIVIAVTALFIFYLNVKKQEKISFGRKLYSSKNLFRKKKK